MPSVISTDVLIVGAGVAGLWLNARLRRQGFSTLVVERESLGGGQSVKSQGIIHGGAKYALHGALTGASEAIADMPRRWREALAGDGELDLRGVRLLSEAHYLWSPGTLAGNLTSFFASKAVRGRVDQVKGDQLPPALQDPRFKGKVYRLAELVGEIVGQEDVDAHGDQRAVGTARHRLGISRLLLEADHASRFVEFGDGGQVLDELAPVCMPLGRAAAHCLGDDVGETDRQRRAMDKDAGGVFVQYLVSQRVVGFGHEGQAAGE